MSDTILKIDHLKKDFIIKDQTVEVLKDISLDVRRGEFISLIGSSGCGKSTILKIITNLEGSFGKGKYDISGIKAFPVAYCRGKY